MQKKIDRSARIRDPVSRRHIMTGQNIAKLRKFLGLSLEEFCGILETGGHKISPSTLSRIESEMIAKVGVDLVEAIGREFHCKLQYLVSGFPESGGQDAEKKEKESLESN